MWDEQDILTRLSKKTSHKNIENLADNINVKHFCTLVK